MHVLVYNKRYKSHMILQYTSPAHLEQADMFLYSTLAHTDACQVASFVMQSA